MTGRQQLIWKSKGREDEGRRGEERQEYGMTYADQKKATTQRLIEQRRERYPSECGKTR